MPELPDIEVFAQSLNTHYARKKLMKLNVVNEKKLRDSPAQLAAALEGRTLQCVYRSGKEMRFEFSGGVLMGLHLMLTGDLFAFDKRNENKFTIVELYFSAGAGLALTDRMRNATIWLNPVDGDGIDALDRRLNFRTLKALLQRKTSVKNVLLDQKKIRGIGNGYSDEILWNARISPFSIAAALPDEKIRELAKAIRSVLRDATARIAAAYPGRMKGEVRDFMQIHTRNQTLSPGGAPIKTEARGLRKTYYTDEQVLYK